MRLLLLILAALLLGAVDAKAAEPCIKHQFVSPFVDEADDTVLRPSDWNACHSEPPKTLTFGYGCTKTACAVLEDDDDDPRVWTNDTERTLTITQVTCWANAGNPTVQLQRDDGSPTNMFSSALTCDLTPSGTDGSDGILTSFVSGENVISPGHSLGFVMVAAGGTAKQILVTLKMTVAP